MRNRKWIRLVTLVLTVALLAGTVLSASAARIVSDVNGDGSANSLDAAQILRFEANLIDGFVKPEDDSTVGE